MNSDAGSRLKRLRVDGGATQNDFLMQFQADILGVPIERPSVVESTALGAAYLAGIGAGMWIDRGAIAPDETESVFTPRMPRKDREAACAGGGRCEFPQAAGLAASQRSSKDIWRGPLRSALRGAAPGKGGA